MYPVAAADGVVITLKSLRTIRELQQQQEDTEIVEKKEYLGCPMGPYPPFCYLLVVHCIPSTLH